ncbi:tetratricopeptide repeat protein [Oceanobacter mangrovi]|uniref:tetratricopeptide repeat protein n=1 Tax=Oceanobacter mangrovi TaxID=2862510 RepID=UPI001C8E6DB7|nr:tetratricopeptide repeat protein [Oceanobacter mangrovi]
MLVRFASFIVLLALGGCGTLGVKDNEPDEAPTADEANQPAEQVEDPNAGIDADTQSIYKHGLILLKSKNFKQAEQHWQMMSERNPDFPGVWVNLALSQYHNGEFEAAKGSVETALQLKPGFCPALATMGPIARELGEFSLAEDNYKQAIACSGNNSADLHYNLGILYDLYMNDQARALVQYKAAQRAYAEDDPQLDIWITDLSKRLEASQPQTPPAAEPAPAEPAEATSATDAAAESSQPDTAPEEISE